MHETSEQPTFVKVVKDIRHMEEEYDRLVNAAKDKAARIIDESKEKALHDRAKAEDEVVAFKNDQLRKGTEDVDAEVQKILKKTKEDGEKLGKKKLDAQAVSKIVKEFLATN